MARPCEPFLLVMHNFHIPWAKPFLGDEEIAAVHATLSDRRLSMGATVKAFEDDAAALVQREHAIAVSNGTVALDLAMKLLKIGPGDEVLVSALAYIATTNCIVWQGATPVFCDVDPVTLNIDPDEVARRITPRTKALLVADYCGSPVDYTLLQAICADHRVQLVVDGAQSLGAYHLGVPTCALGTVSTTSFHTAKAMLTGEGGMVFTDSEELAERARKMRGQGEIPGRKYVHDTLAWNYRLTEMAAAIGRVQLSRASEILAKRAALAARYTEQLGQLPEVVPTGHYSDGQPAWFSYAVRVPNRDAVAESLAEQGVETRSLYPVPAYRQPIPEYAPFANELRPHAELASDEVLNLPMFYEMTFAEVDEVVASLATALAAPAVDQPAAA
ncbi:MAG TPA: DegT/DnrJ/EryC1/StrS family aminotransferase [Thermoleophilaceae bacterium]